MPLNKILLVDDDKALNFLNRIELLANQVDCTIDEVLNGQQALDYIASVHECPDVILLDINMPGIDGFGFLKEFNAKDKCCDQSKIFMLTSSQREEDINAALSYSFVKGYFDKPLTKAHIQEMLSAVN
jgi:CheY-like chemotaxis protein